MIIGQTWMQPDKMPAWELYGANLLTEHRQCLEEGKDVAAFEPLIRAVFDLKDARLREELADTLHEALLQARQRPDYPFDEPSGLEAILLARPVQRPLLPEPAVGDALREKIAGAWYGRVSGCLLGKPVEGWRTPKLWRLLQGSGNFPLQTYIRRDDALLAELGMPADRCWIDTIKSCAPSDDDTNYTVLSAIRLVGRYGRAFTPEQAARTWLDSQPMTAYCTAERVAFRNFVTGILPPQSALYKNPFREWIGAQIRADYFGYINPGAPAAAAEMAWRDASISHVKNGIYGEMFVAAMLAAAAATDDIGLIIRAGLAEIPEKSRLRRDVARVLDWRAPAFRPELASAGFTNNSMRISTMTGAIPIRTR